jgi:PTH2 family peptidyl-tRNA hydrolase
MDIKQVIVIRKDLNMRKGKMIAQGAHASLLAFLNTKSDLPLQEWLNGIYTKICVSVNSEQELLDVYNKAKELGISCSLIQDCGLTEFNGIPTYTAVAVGPDYNEKIDSITGNLPLL